MVDAYRAPEAKLTVDETTNAFGSVETAVAGTYSFSVKEICKEAWQLIKGAKLTFLLSCVVYILLYSIAAAAIRFLLVAVGFDVQGFFGEEVSSATSAYSLGNIIESAVLTLLITPLWVGFFMMGAYRAVGREVSVEMLFAHYDKILPLFLVTILYYLFVVAGLILLVLPGIYLVFALSMAMPLVVDKKMKPLQALGTSRKAVTKKWFRFCALSLICILAVVAGFLTLGIGLIWFAPFVMVAFGIAYRNMFGVSGQVL